MKISFCGGAREVGASCYLLKLDDTNILLDCGIRMKSSDNLPDFSLIQQEGGVDTIIISHAHLDHSGALPVISREYPGARIYMTHASKSLIQVLLYDSLKIMEREEADIPIYAEKHVREMLDRVICYSPQYEFKALPEKNIQVSFYNAGHIAGAALIYIKGQEGTLLYTGDYSASDQQTVNGCSVPRLRPDVMITESTYGDKLHSSRKIEEKRLVDTVKEVINREGKILIPAFALGRAQEIILLLKKAINKKELPEFKVYVDGMVRAVNRIYRLNPNYLKSNLARRVFRENDIFYDDNIIEVKDHEMRERIIEEEEPMAIISSSGMLKGGPSCFYAEKLIGEEKNFVAITGYQDEETPGSDVLELLESDEEEREIVLNNERLIVNCELGKYGLSAHVDKGELLGLTHRVTPRKIFLVHGDSKVIESLAVDMNKDVRAGIYVPVNGETVSVDYRNPRKQLDFRNKIASLNSAQELDKDNIERLWEYLYQKGGIEKAYSIEELIYIQEGVNYQPGMEEKAARYRELLNKSRYFSPNRRRLFLYHPVSEEELAEDDGIMEMNQLFEVVDKLFPPETGLYKRGARTEDNTVLLSFNFPSTAADKYRDDLQELQEESGWQVELNQDCNQVALEDEVYRLFAADFNIDKFSYYRTEGKCLVILDRKPDNNQELIMQFKEKTGIELELDYPEKEKQGNREEGLSLKEVNPEEMMEQNQAFEYIDKLFNSLGVKIYKKSRKLAGVIPYLEIYFISPELGERYRETVRRLEEDTGWNIRIGQTPIQNEIINLARRLAVQYGLRLCKNPAHYRDKLLVEIKVNGKLDEKKQTEMEAKFKEETGYLLRVSNMK
ncbi:MAG TPA: MBL fold metallo-hydrolase [Halanaerobiales bacterium]|nr:MBL fold metallo-hydrolase [Halanaerobiales bacterium]